MADQSTNFTASNGEYRNPFYQGTFEDETIEQMERRLRWAAAAVEAERVVQNNKTAPQPVEQQPVSWIRIRGDHVILSRCDWMYPESTEDSAGLRDEQRFTAVGRRDGDIILPAPEGAVDREDLKTMLDWSTALKPAEQQPAPDVSTLVEALKVARIDLKLWLESFPIAPREPTGKIIELIDAALAAHRKGGEL